MGFLGFFYKAHYGSSCYSVNDGARELSQMNKTLAALTDDDFEGYVLGRSGRGRSLICGDPHRRMAFELVSKYAARRESALNVRPGWSQTSAVLTCWSRASLRLAGW
jgi:hypothetical protein